MVGQINASDKRSARIRFSFILITFVDVQLLFAVIPLALRFAHHAPLASRHLFAEQIIGTHTYHRVLARQVIATIGFNLDGEVGQIVTADTNVVRRVTVQLVAFDADPDPVIAEPRVFRDGPIESDDAETGAGNDTAQDSD